MENKWEGNILDGQQTHWEKTFSKRKDMFGKNPSHAAMEALKEFKKEGITNILELGAGQGRDTIYFAQNGLKVHALEYTEQGINSIQKKAEELELTESITVLRHDVKHPFPLEPETFQGCFSHMLYCMAFTTKELEFITDQIWRILQQNGLNIYTARNTLDTDYKKGIHVGEDLYENNGFIVHFFSKEKIQHLAQGFEIIKINEFEEGQLPRKLYLITLRKKSN